MAAVGPGGLGFQVVLLLALSVALTFSQSAVQTGRSALGQTRTDTQRTCSSRVGTTLAQHGSAPPPPCPPSFDGGLESGGVPGAAQAPGSASLLRERPVAHAGGMAPTTGGPSGSGSVPAVSAVLLHLLPMIPRPALTLAGFFTAPTPVPTTPPSPARPGTSLAAGTGSPEPSGAAAALLALRSAVARAFQGVGSARSRLGGPAPLGWGLARTPHLAPPFLLNLLGGGSEPSGAVAANMGPRSARPRDFISRAAFSRLGGPSSIWELINIHSLWLTPLSFASDG